MEIKKATKDDILSVVALNNTVQRIHAEAHPHIFKYPTDSSELKLFYSQLIDRESNFILIAVNELGDAVGYIWAEVYCSPENPFKFESSVMYVNQIAVTPAYRGLGIGHMLMRRIEEYSVELRLHRLELDSWMFNQDAYKAFEKMGFTKYRTVFWKSI